MPVFALGARCDRREVTSLAADSAHRSGALREAKRHFVRRREPEPSGVSGTLVAVTRRQGSELSRLADAGSALPVLRGDIVVTPYPPPEVRTGLAGRRHD